MIHNYSVLDNQKSSKNTSHATKFKVEENSRTFQGLAKKFKDFSRKNGIQGLSPKFKDISRLCEPCLITKLDNYFWNSIDAKTSLSPFKKNANRSMTWPLLCSPKLFAFQ